MFPGRVVEPLDVVEYVYSRGVARPVNLAADSLRLERREEPLHRGLVPDMYGSARRAIDAVLGYQLLELLAGVLGGFNWSSQRQ